MAFLVESTEAVAAAVAPATENNENSAEQAPVETKIIFGQNLTDRVINAASPTDLGSEQTASSSSSVNQNGKSGENGEAAGSSSEAKAKAPAAALWSASNENEYAERNEIEDLNTILKMNCKLYVLESDKANWAERGYGMLKLIDTPDETNCKISKFVFYSSLSIILDFSKFYRLKTCHSFLLGLYLKLFQVMWMDKSFRLLLNTKLFEKMQIDKLNKKSVRFNAFDSGTIRLFLVKVCLRFCCFFIGNFDPKS